METEYKTYRDEKVALPFCKGCGHTHVIRQLDAALVKLQFDPSDVCLVTDIGCIGLADPLFEQLHTVHTTHGRSTAFATGIELTDSIIGGSKLKTIVLIGDGGATIGLQHLVQAALLNVDITVLVCNNFLYGMTGGQNSGFSPTDFVTSTTPWGNFVPPLDFSGIMVSSKAGFVDRISSTDRRLGDVIADAIAHPGFSVVEILEICPEYAVPMNVDVSSLLPKKSLSDEHPESFPLTSARREEFAEMYRRRVDGADHRKRSRREAIISQNCPHALSTPVRIIVAGTAGERVQSAAGILAEAAVHCGLNITQKNDNQVTQGSGFSLSELCISPDPIYYTGVSRPDAVLIVSEDGLREISMNGTLDRMTEETVVVFDSGLLLEDGRARKYKFPFREEFGARQAALAAASYYIQLTEIVPTAAFLEVLKARSPDLETWFLMDFLRKVRGEQVDKRRSEK
jgi:pyruvate/2-oxoacid:ferredoxin oxidoreductase beta subunit/Pyruvate/2-oxoacid:ferredoxin oxidoreductase gamma subunit